MRNVNLKEFEKIKWKRIWARRILMFLGAGFQKVFLRHKPYVLARHKMYIPEGNLFAFCLAENEFNKLVRLYTKQLMRENLAIYAKKYEAEFVNYLKFAQSFAKKPFRRMSNQRLAETVKELDERIVDFYEYQFYPFFVLEGLGRQIEKKLAKAQGGEKILQAISTPYKFTKINKAYNELLTLAQKNFSVSQIKAYASKYGWMAVYDYPDAPWTWQEVRKHLKDIKNPKQELIHNLNNRKNYLAYYRKYLTGVKDRKWRKQIEIVHYFSYLKEMRDDYRRYAYALIRPMWEEVSKRLDTTVSDLNYLKADELADVLQALRPLPRAEIEQRKKCCALASVDGKVEVFSGNKAKKLAGFVLGSGHKEIKGRIAFSGKVRGKVKIIYHRGEFDKLNNGEILVTTMTHPEFLSIMKKAGAIVTDEGGMLCHAAITSREMKIPCIIGTNIATRVLKDGDLVEVDANHGYVRKIA